MAVAMASLGSHSRVATELDMWGRRRERKRRDPDSATEAQRRATHRTGSEDSRISATAGNEEADDGEVVARVSRHMYCRFPY